MKSTDQIQIPFIQALRGLAAIVVAIYHTTSHVPVGPNNATSQWFFASGPAAVDLFFMLSGFVMVLSTQNKEPSLENTFRFWINRFFRIWPTYFVITLLFCLTEVIVRKHMNASLIADWELHAWTAVGILRSMLFLPLDYAAGAPYFGGAVLHVGWTMNYEMYFYFILGGSLFLGRYRWLAFFSWIGVTLIAPLFLINPWYHFFDVTAYHDFRPGYLNLITSPIIWDFVAGVVIGLVYISRLRIRNIQALYMALMLAMCIATWNILGGMPRHFGFQFWSGPLALTFVFLALLNKEQEIAIPAPLLWLGKISFSLYLVHPLVIAPAYFLTRGTEIEKYTYDFPFTMLVTATSIALAWISYELLEVRLSSLLKRKIIGNRFTLRLKQA